MATKPSYKIIKEKVMGEKKYIVVGEQATTFNANANNIYLTENEEIVPVSSLHNNNELTITIKGRAFTCEIVKLKQNECYVLVNGNTYSFSIESEQSYKREKQLSKTIASGSCKVMAPLPGTICEVFVQKNQKVKKGEALFLLEAMKMQNEIVSPSDGVINSILTKESESVLKDQVLLEIE